MPEKQLVEEIKMTQVKPSEFKELVKAAATADPPQNVLGVGGPGIGKSEIVEQGLIEVSVDHIISHPGVEDPTVPAGMPDVASKKPYAEFKPFGPLYRALTATKRTCWNLEDFGQAPNAVQAAYMQLLLKGEVSGHVLPKGLISFIVTTNRRTDRSGVTGILEAVKSRFATIVELVVDNDEWVDWAVGKSWMDPMIIAFIRFQRDMLYQFDPSSDLVNCPLPRTWANASRITAMGLTRATERAALAGAVGEGAARAFLGFREMFNQLPTIDAILKDPENAPVPEGIGPLYAITTTLAAKAEPGNFDAVTTYVERMINKGYGDYGTLLVRDAIRRTPTLQQTNGFLKLYSGEIGKLLTGVDIN
jgi:hypothetical protein